MVGLDAQNLLWFVVVSGGYYTAVVGWSFGGNGDGRIMCVFTIAQHFLLAFSL